MGHASQQSETQSMDTAARGILDAAGRVHIPYQVSYSSLLPYGVAGNAYKTP